MMKTKIDKFKIAITNYVNNRYKTSDNKQYFNSSACTRDFQAGIEYLLELGYKSPEEVKSIESKATMYGYDWATDKW